MKDEFVSVLGVVREVEVEDTIGNRWTVRKYNPTTKAIEAYQPVDGAFPPINKYPAPVALDCMLAENEYSPLNQEIFDEMVVHTMSQE